MLAGAPPLVVRGEPALRHHPDWSRPAWLTLKTLARCARADAASLPEDRRARST